MICTGRKIHAEFFRIKTVEAGQSARLHEYEDLKKIRDYLMMMLDFTVPFE